MDNGNLKIIKNKNSALRKKSRPVSAITPTEKNLFDKMKRLMLEEKGIGLAAPQMGVSKQMIVVNTKNGVIELANPRIINRQEKKCQAPEGCLSLPGITVKVNRFEVITVAAMDINGKQIEFKAESLFARVIQHEIDHLDGRLIIDYLPWYKRLFAIHSRS